MATMQWILLEESKGYRIAAVGAQGVAFWEVPVSAGAGPKEVAAAAAKALEENDYRGSPLALALGPKSCLAATIRHQGRSMARDRQVMAYTLEEHLPLAAEKTVADFIVFPEEALAVAVEVALVGPLVAALEKAGLPVQSVAPLPLLALRQDMEADAPKAPLVVLWQHENTVELFDVTDGRPRLWRSLAAEPNVLLRELHVLARTHREEFSVRTHCLDGPLLDAVRSVPEVQDLSPHATAMAEAAATVAARRLQGQMQGWIELCRSPIGSGDPYGPIRGALRAVTITAVMLALMVSVALSIRTYRTQRLAEQYRQDQREAFQRALPDRAVPVGILSRLESEYQQMAGVTGQADVIPQPCSALRQLHQVLSALPSDLRYRVLEMRIESEQIYLEGEARHHGDADLLATELRNAGFEVEPPHTQQLATEGVAWRINASTKTGDDNQQPEGDPK
ncbi:MAG: hypothetical protein HQ567_21420 [Candidatus Nealsonbacteria bacterium]|nr:hypothetical protein [Candidatus Nealsonbacteria bacterium]